jgi:hypothetical protein
MEPQSRSNDDQTRYQAQYWNGPEAGHWQVQEPRYERMAVAGLLAGWTLGYAGLHYVVGLRARSREALTALVPLFLPISLLSTAYVPAGLLPGWVPKRRGRQPLQPRGRHRPRRHDRDPGCRPARRRAGRGRRSRRPHPAGRRPRLRRPRPPWAQPSRRTRRRGRLRARWSR